MKWWQQDFWWSSNIAGWIGGLGTVAALFFAGWQVRRERIATNTASALTTKSLEQTEIALRLQALRDEADLEERERVQASLVSCGTSHVTGSQVIRFQITNRSPVPIFDVNSFVNMAQSTVANAIGAIGPNAEQQANVTVAANQAVPSGQFSGITFRDNAGAHWIKWGDGILIRGDASQVATLSPRDVIITPQHDPRIGQRASHGGKDFRAQLIHGASSI